MNLKQLFLDKDGKLSSKRVMAYVLLFYSMVMYTLGTVDVVANDNTILGLFIAAGTTGLGLGLLERKS